MDRRGPVAGDVAQPLEDDALLNAIADAFEQTDDYARWLQLINAGKLEEAYRLVQGFVAT